MRICETPGCGRKHLAKGLCHACYYRKRDARLKDEWLDGKSCVWVMEDGSLCGSTENLELDHIDPATKDPRLKNGQGHRIWGWSEVQREAELAKCQPLCHDCHVEKTRVNGEGPFYHQSGESHLLSKLTEDDVREIRRLVAEGMTQKNAASLFVVDPKTVSLLVRRITWKHVM